MPRSSRRVVFWHPQSVVPFFVLFLLTAASPAFAQRGASMGHGGGAHFARAAHTPAPLARRGAHIPYQRSARGARPFSRGTAHIYSPFITHQRPFLRNSFFLNSRFTRYPFLPYAYGYGLWPWWGSDSYDSGDECNPYYSDCGPGPGSYVQNAQPGSYIETAGDTAPSSYVSSYNDTPRPIIVVYLRDGSGYGALDYWVTNGVLHIATTYGVQKSFPMDDVDLERTGKENALNGVNFTFGNAPMISDPGPVLAPDSYAPPCLAVPTRSHATAAASPNAQANFGATGSPSEKGFAVTSVRANSLAAQAGLQVGDVVVRVDCQPIRNSQDLETAFDGQNTTVWVSYLIQGSWLTDKKIVRQ
jgi:PDZ domain